MRRVVVTGMGKSGHIGRKWAATMAATGTPAIYVHPAEAAHGDVGMLVPGDILIVISNSGNTSELRAFLRFGAVRPNHVRHAIRDHLIEGKVSEQRVRHVPADQV